MSRTWRNERTTPKKQPRKGTQRPRMSEFAQEHYEGKGYTVTLPVERDSGPDYAWCDGGVCDE